MGLGIFIALTLLSRTGAEKSRRTEGTGFSARPVNTNDCSLSRSSSTRSA